MANLPVFAGQTQTTPGVTILLGKGNGAFTSGQTLLTSYAVSSVTLADVNGDGKLDLIATMADAHVGYWLAVALGNGDGSFKTPTILTTDFGASSVAVGDFNGDQKADLIVAHCCVDTDMTYLLGKGDGTFQPEVHFDGSASPNSVLALDLNRDGKPDLAIADDNYANSGLTILLSLPAAAIPTITNVSAASFLDTPLSAESIVTAFGANLATATDGAAMLPLPTNLDGTTVTVTDSAGAARQAPLFFISATQVNYEIPVGTANGNPKVTIASPAGTSYNQVWIENVAPAFFQSNTSTGLGAGSTLLIAPDGIQRRGISCKSIPRATRWCRCRSTSARQAIQVILTLYATGIRNRTSVSNVVASIGGVPSQVQFAGAQGTFDGLDQLNVVIPSSLSGKGQVAVEMTVDGVDAIPAIIDIQ